MNVAWVAKANTELSFLVSEQCTAVIAEIFFLRCALCSFVKTLTVVGEKDKAKIKRQEGSKWLPAK